MHGIMKDKYEIQKKIKELEERIKYLQEELEAEYPDLYKSLAGSARSKILALQWTINQKPTL